MSDELKCCLWCEENNIIIKRGVSVPFGPANVMHDGFYAACQTDDCSAHTLHQLTEKDAINAWNAEDVWGYDI